MDFNSGGPHIFLFPMSPSMSFSKFKEILNVKISRYVGFADKEALESANKISKFYFNITVDSRYSEIGYSESPDIVNGKKCRIWFSPHRANVNYLRL